MSKARSIHREGIPMKADKTTVDHKVASFATRYISARLKR